MRVLLDEQLPRQLAPYLVGHDARTVQQQGWAGLKNGELLKQAEAARFEIFLTSDRTLSSSRTSRGPVFSLSSWSLRATRSKIYFLSSRRPWQR